MVCSARYSITHNSAMATRNALWWTGLIVTSCMLAQMPHQSVMTMNNSVWVREDCRQRYCKEMLTKWFHHYYVLSSISKFHLFTPITQYCPYPLYLHLNTHTKNCAYSQSSNQSVLENHLCYERSQGQPAPRLWEVICEMRCHFQHPETPKAHIYSTTQRICDASCWRKAKIRERKKSTPTVFMTLTFSWERWWMAVVKEPDLFIDYEQSQSQLPIVF